MLIGITGASGFIGRKVVDLALNRGHEVVAFSRDPSREIPGCEMRRFSLDAPPDITGCEAVVHLAGESVVGLWTPSKRRRILQSRVDGTRRVVEAIQTASIPPEVFVSGSAVGFYRDSGDSELTEHSPPGAGFLSDTVQAWEAAAAPAGEFSRLVYLRTGVVLGRKGGALKVMRPIFRAGLGAQISDGTQWMPWIHLDDIAMLTVFAIENLEIRGALNGTSPWPVRNKEFTETLGQTLRRPVFLRAPAAFLRLLGEISHELLDSKRVLPAVATEHRFRFQYPEIGPALKDLVG